MTTTISFYGRVTKDFYDYIKFMKQKVVSLFLKKEDLLGPLPLKWEKRVDSEGRVYFANILSKTTQWEDPRIHGYEDPLPPGWVVQYTGTARLKIYFDQNTNTYTDVDPRLDYNAGSEGTFKPVPYSMKLQWKLAEFYSLCECNKVESTIKFKFTTIGVFKDLFIQMMKYQPHQLRGKLLRTFEGEGELNNEDLATKWILVFSAEVLDPKYGLFAYADKYQNTLEINTASPPHPNRLVYFRFIGRFIAMALFHKKCIYKRLSYPFYKCILQKHLEMKDLEYIDMEYYKSLVWIEENNIDEYDLELFFAVSFEKNGKIDTHLLRPSGHKIKVTEKNKEQFLRYIYYWRLYRGYNVQLKAFMKGFNDVFPSEWLRYFNPAELEEMLVGQPEPIDVEDWKENTVYKNCSEEDEYIKWFWKFVNKLNYDMKSRLLRFVTGTHRLPFAGFSDLMGSYGPQPFCIEIVGVETLLPRSLPCMNRLELPPYKDYNQFKTKMKFALDQFEESPHK